MDITIANEQNNQLELLKKIKTTSIISLVLIFTLIGVIVTWILDIINAVRILSTKWVKQEVENSKLIWGIFTIVVLGPISSLIFSCIAINKYNDQAAV
ncbi:MAG: hypothetical protein K2H80_00575 [Ureaplasma sp.]|nr:hypothetical protein [Ureaplasma sp.]